MTWILAAGLAASLTLQSAPGSSTGTDPVVTRARASLAAMAAGDFASVEAQFTPDVAKALPSGRLATVWATLSRDLGAYGGCSGDPRVVRIADKQMVISACRFGPAALDIQFAYDSSGKISGIAFRPADRSASPSALPSYASREAYSEEEVTIGTAWALPGTLSLPKAEGTHPAVILVGGSGPGDRDAGIGPNRPFRDLAAGLASQGIAVLRYDKRSKVHAAKLADRTITVKDEVIDDVVEAMALLRRHPRIDKARVFVLGLSLGGMLIPRIAAAEPGAAGWIVLAGAARPIEDAVVAQARHLASSDGSVSPEEQKALDEMAAIAGRIRSLQPEDAANTDLIFGAPASYWLDLRSYDAPAAAREIKERMLILQGDRDYQVTTAEFERWKKALGHRSDVTFRNYASLNHLFMPGKGPSLPAEYLVPNHVDEQVVRDIAAWILGRPAGAAR
jgi:dienelactone hydrolase